MSTTAQINSRIALNRTLTQGVENAASPRITQEAGSDGSLNGVVGAVPRLALVAGAKTVDLTALADINSATADFSSKKLRGLLLENLSTDNNMTFAKGASSGFAALPGTWSFELLPLMRVVLDLRDVELTDISAVGGASKTIDVSGIGTDLFNLALVFE